VATIFLRLFYFYCVIFYVQSVM